MWVVMEIRIARLVDDPILYWDMNGDIDAYWQVCKQMHIDVTDTYARQKIKWINIQSSHGTNSLLG